MQYKAKDFKIDDVLCVQAMHFCCIAGGTWYCYFVFCLATMVTHDPKIAIFFNV